VIEHLVCFKLKADAPPEAIEKMMRELRGLPARVPGIRELTCGANFSARSQGYTHGLLVRFASRADLEAYGVHPEHQRVVVEAVQPVLESLLVVDYEV
jgi:hypothetical protein